MLDSRVRPEVKELLGGSQVHVEERCIAHIALQVDAVDHRGVLHRRGEHQATACCIGRGVRLSQHGHSHHDGRFTQAEVIHEMIHCHVVNLGLDIIDPRDVRPVEIAQLVECRGLLGAVHAGTGVEGICKLVALDRQLEQAVLGRCIAKHDTCLLVIEGRTDLVPVAILVVAVLLEFREEAYITLLAGCDDIGKKIVFQIIGAGSTRYATVESFLFGKCTGIALEQHGTATAATPVLQCLYAADHLDLFIGFECGPARGRVHPVGTATVDVGTVKQDIELCLGLATDDRFEAAATEAAHIDAVDLAEELTTVGRCASCS